ncbi:DNA repair protein recN Recombination protein N [Proteiniborus sp. DW1]|uniref:DNA repair protein RecN n=1 Tax=Proteiniborus sp. DW1 TaxID=1889883 RepID=UPI00092E089C|nr:DNA repair protein RecN [Proteiniborus sp. DW1]SCG83321.1 DNA repair protein recN Recombination protein N [Proteiniborus sp. DW1]
MLLELNIQNFAIINKIRVNFSKGLNVLTGETGAGKSIIIDAISLVLGSRADKEFVRAGSEKTTIEALFFIENMRDVERVLESYGIQKEKDNTLLITREIYNTGRSTSRVNGRTVTLSMLHEITSKLIDIHGQHDHQSLLRSDKHSEFIDSLGDYTIIEIKEKVKKGYEELQTLKSRLKSLSQDEMEKERKMDLLNFQIEEIDDARLIDGEEESLIAEYSLLSNAESIVVTLADAIANLDSGFYGNKSIIDQLNNIYTNLHKVSKHSEDIRNFANTFESIVYQLQDLTREIRYYQDKIDYSPERLKFLDERLDLINKLKRKYGKTINEILEYRDRINKDLNLLLNCEEEIRELRSKIQQCETELNNICKDLTEKRTCISEKFEREITKELSDVNMPNVNFKVKIEKLEHFTQNGLDKIEFLISTNPNEPLKSLAKIVSGGEMSRIMLAFKSILAEIDKIPTLIFDEIDTGISGRTAQIVGEKIANIASNHQVICITHLPQIAALADSHYLIHKKITDKELTTEIIKLDYNERVEELSRLLGGVSLTETTKQHAREMIEMSKKIR